METSSTLAPMCTSRVKTDHGGHPQHRTPLYHPRLTLFSFYPNTQLFKYVAELANNIRINATGAYPVLPL